MAMKSEYSLWRSKQWLIAISLGCSRGLYYVLSHSLINGLGEKDANGTLIKFTVDIKLEEIMNLREDRKATWVGEK